MTSGGAMRTTVPCVSLDRMPRASRRSTTARAVTFAVSTSMPMKSPRPRTSVISGLVDLAQLATAATRQATPSARTGLRLEHVERGERDGGRERIAAERAAVVARSEHLHHVVGGDEHRTPAAGRRPAPCRGSRRRAARRRARSASMRPVRPSPVWISSQIRSTLLLAADARALGEIAVRRHDDAAFALHRLDQERRGVGRDRRVQRRGVAVTGS